MSKAGTEAKAVATVGMKEGMVAKEVVMAGARKNTAVKVKDTAVKRVNMVVKVEAAMEVVVERKNTDVRAVAKKEALVVKAEVAMEAKKEVTVEATMAAAMEAKREATAEATTEEEAAAAAMEATVKATVAATNPATKPASNTHQARATAVHLDTAGRTTFLAPHIMPSSMATPTTQACTRMLSEGFLVASSSFRMKILMKARWSVIISRCMVVRVRLVARRASRWAVELPCRR